MGKLKTEEIKITVLPSDDPDNIKEKNFQQGIKYAISLLKKIKEKKDLQEPV